MQESPSEANTHSASQKIPCTYMKPEGSWLCPYPMPDEPSPQSNTLFL